MALETFFACNLTKITGNVAPVVYPLHSVVIYNYLW